MGRSGEPSLGHLEKRPCSSSPLWPHDAAGIAPALSWEGEKDLEPDLEERGKLRTHQPGFHMQM